MYIREQLSVLEKRILENKNLIQVITGPRQVGKTTLALQLIEKTELEHSYVSADAVPSSSSGWIEQQWEAARIKLKSSSKKPFLLIIDEIQKIDNWSEYVKKEWDKDRKNKLKLKVVLLGSSTLLIDKGLSESLAGRFELTKLPHWSLSEMKDAFSFTSDEYVYFGGYPGAAEFINDEQRWRDYIFNSIIETTISKDILQLTYIQKPALLKNLFELACTFNGEILSYTKILGQLTDAGNTTTLSHYQNLLDKVWFISGLQKFSGSKVIQKSSIPKWLAYNTAFSSVYSNTDFKTTKNVSDIWGRLVEQAIGAYLINQSRISGMKVYYWREGNNEVDYIIQKGSKIISIEVKSGKFKAHKGLEEFRKKYKPYKSILISNDSLNWQEFLKLKLTELFD
jgi:uncharacterized protein